MDIIVDDRESQGGVLDHLRLMPEMTVTVSRLRLGDYLVDQRVLFERKTLADFAASLTDGRLFEQACRLASSPHRAVYLLEGAAADVAAVGVRREAMQGALITLQIVLDIPVLRAMNAEESARLIRYTAEQMERVRQGAVVRPGYRPKGKRRRQLYILQGLPGIGPARAERLLAAFGNVAAVLSADSKRLSAVEGVGYKTAEAIRHVVSEARSVYGRKSSG
jgi:DNA excision repair protein ERCC-4